MDGIVNILWDILWNVVGGIFAGLSVLGIVKLCNLIHSLRFKRFFGVEENYHIIYTLFNTPLCPKNDPSCILLFKKSSPPNTGFKAHSGINLKQVTSIASAKGVGYLIEAFSSNLKKAPKIFPDVDHNIISKSNISFVSIGGTTNYKSYDLLHNSSNIFLLFNERNIISAIDKNIIVKLENAGFEKDYGFIVKIHPYANPKRTWICCCGFGITGTIGAAYYLSEKWKKIKKYTGNQPFGCIIKSKSGSEEETTATHILIKSKSNFIDLIRKYKAKKHGLELVIL